MKANLIKNHKSKSINWRKYDTKEVVNHLQAVGIKNNKIKSAVDAKFYMGRSSNASVVYCVVRVFAEHDTYCGAGDAGGGGYHKESAALAEAILNAGIYIDGHFGGRGDRAMEEALVAIAVDILGFDPETVEVMR